MHPRVPPCACKHVVGWGCPLLPCRPRVPGARLHRPLHLRVPCGETWQPPSGHSSSACRASHLQTIRSPPWLLYLNFCCSQALTPPGCRLAVIWRCTALTSAAMLGISLGPLPACAGLGSSRLQEAWLSPRHVPTKCVAIISVSPTCFSPPPLPSLFCQALMCPAATSSTLLPWLVPEPASPSLLFRPS